MPRRRKEAAARPRTVLIPPDEHCWIESDAYDRSAFAALVADAPSLAKVVEEGGALVPHFRALVEDVFCLLFKLEPRLRPAEAVAPAAALNRTLLEAFHGHALLEHLRERTPLDETQAGLGAGGRTSPGRQIELGRRLATNPKLRKLAAAVGRMREQALALRRSPFERASEEVFDVRLGKDLERLLPPELLALHHPLLRRDFARRLVEGRLLSYALRGADERGRGPMIVCLDGSGSMAGDKEIWSKAVALTLLEIARRQPRSFRFICFSSADTPLFTLDLNPRERHEVQEDRALDLADQQGAFAGKLLAGLGADVVLVEPPEGSPLRSIPPFWQGVEDPERSLFFWFYNAGKRGIALDWRRPEGAERLRRLAARSDVVIETEPPGTLAALGLRALNPRLVIASITPYGQTGPYRVWRASDMVAQAIGGMMFVNGHRD